MAQKMKYEVQEDETVAECLDRIKKDGYTPIKRVEKPIFKEVIKSGLKTYEPVSSKIIFEAVKID